MEPRPRVKVGGIDLTARWFISTSTAIWEILFAATN